MGYIYGIKVQLTEMLADLDEAQQKEVIKFCKEKIYKSYLNGRKEIGGVDRESEQKIRKVSRER